MPTSALPTLQLALRLDDADVFGAMEWVLANARRTGLTLQQLGFNAGTQANLTVSAPDTDLLQLFVRRLDNGMDVEVLLADFSDDEEALEDVEAATLPASRPASQAALHA
ncbi:hypothetical protein [Cupriavidus sp. IDO]|uniref:hypothetical protein n=1 Tax=Cupriavidus sp. IDO TaxID=1539142 RepID=UPI000578F45B|nr:hypothetical protein [Cupriavidus sp. IDO]KWR90525.1 AsnC family transcriptional regulator [Cupriavidus sp. IDO]